ncbi:ABC transporter substrate-binding protein [Amycolatopsis sp. NPDC006125]|uniref:ABC transporter substrate-binding protein n=1 Tax=Amycolatopsis sp. NPDC006125 TaxID=3156730 RepID=UPI0033B9A861
MDTSLSRGGPGLSRRTALSGALALGTGLLGAGLTACAGRGAGSTDGQAELGWIQPKTGRLASAYAPTFIGTRLALQEINAAGGLLGTAIAVHEEDDEGSPATQATVAQRLLSARPDFVVGPTGSSQAVASVTALARGNAIQSAWGGADLLGDGARFPGHYQLVFNTSRQGRAAAKFLFETRGLRRIGLLTENSEFGKSMQESFTRTLREDYRTELAGVQVFEPNAPDMTPYLNQLARAGVEGLGMFSGQPQAAVLSLRAMANGGFAPVIVAHDLNYIDAYNEIPVELLRNFYGTAYRSLTYPRGGAPSGPAVEYAAKIRAEAGQLAFSAANSPYYDFLKLLATVVEQERTTDPERLRAAFDRVRGYPGVRAPISFTETDHCGIGDDAIAIATLLSARDEASAGGIFRELAS